MITEMLTPYIREVRVRVWWGEKSDVAEERGDEIIVADNSHIFRSEAGGASALGGISYHTLSTDERGMLDPDEVAGAVKPADVHYPHTAMVALENTHNARGGVPLTAEDTKSIADVAHSHNLAMHIDGARIFNASVYLETPVSELVKDADSVSFCLSKGLGAPAGTVLAGDRATIDRAFRARKMLGGGMRQVGHLAAAGLHALEHNIDRLADDHARAERIAEGFRAIDALSLTQDTNMVWVTPPAEHHDDLVAHLESEGLSACFWKPTMRFVTHLDIDDAQVEALIDTFQRFFADRT